MGTIIIARPLDAEQRSFYNMTVEVTDGTNMATTQVSRRRGGGDIEGTPAMFDLVKRGTPFECLPG